MINEIKMQELKNMFFYVFGIVPLQNYNVVDVWLIILI